MNFQRLTDFLDWLPSWRIPGVDMMIAVDGETVYRHQAGWRDREKQLPMTGDELYWIYSASKVITCAAALTLYEQGKYLLSDPVSEYIPAFKDLTVRRVRPDGQTVIEPAKQAMTIRHLFTMTSGLNYDLAEPQMLEAVKQSGGKAPTVEIAKAIAKRPLMFEPGSHWLYSLSHDVLAAVTEVIAGMPFRDYVQKTIFDPCGMKDSGYHMTDEKLPRMAQQYRFDDAKGVSEPIGPVNGFIFGSEYDSGGAGMVSSVEDYMRFARMMTRLGVADNGERILSPGTINLMRTNHLNAVQMQDLDWQQFVGYGYGLGVRTMVDRTVCGSNGPVGEFGWGGAAGAYVIIDPENRVTAYYAQHMLNNQEPFVHPRLRNLVYACLEL